MFSREHVVSAFALIFLAFFCWPILALTYGMWTSVAPSTPWMRIAVGMTNTEIANSVHSLLLPLLGAMIVFRANDLIGWAGSLLLILMGLGILAGFVVFAFTNPGILGKSPEFAPYVTEYGDVHRSILSMTSMLILLFLTKLGLDPKLVEATKGNPPEENKSGPAQNPVSSPVQGAG